VVSVTFAAASESGNGLRAKEDQGG
jgi:hypothetical protein